MNASQEILEGTFVRERAVFDRFKCTVLALAERNLLTQDVLDCVASGFRYENIAFPLADDDEAEVRLMRTVVAFVDPAFPIEDLLADYQQGNVDAWRVCSDKWFEICYNRWDWCPSPSAWE